ncbi:MAG: 3'-5' exonuclease [Chloroflexi bacterium]|nr:3'-5' exonuclease [Chloroflexota bacterium]
MLNLELTRPLAIIDVQSTGVDPTTARIVSLGVLKIDPDGTEHLRSVRFNPGTPIPAGATAVHGITDEEVADFPPFRSFATALAGHLEDCDLAGFGIERFGAPLLQAEFKRAGTPFDLKGRRVIDTMSIFHKKEPRDFQAAYEVFVGGVAPPRSDSEAFVKASLDVLSGELEVYEDIGNTVDALHEFLHPLPENAVDERGMLIRAESGDLVLNFGRHKGRSAKDVAMDAPDYLEWLTGQPDIPVDMKAALAEELGSGG